MVKNNNKKIHFSSSKQRTAQMMNLSLNAMSGLEKRCITSAYLPRLFHLGERVLALWPLVSIFSSGGHLVQWSESILAILVKGHKRNSSMKNILKSGL